jgi:transcriptional regulator GlxA family with amidase domain
VCISERQLHRVFASQCASVASEIKKLRLELALDLLQTSTLPVTEIAFKTGYDSLSTFYRAIKKSKGCTATDIRHQAVNI